MLDDTHPSRVPHVHMQIVVRMFWSEALFSMSPFGSIRHTRRSVTRRGLVHREVGIKFATSSLTTHSRQLIMTPCFSPWGTCVRSRENRKIGKHPTNRQTNKFTHQGQYTCLDDFLFFKQVYKISSFFPFFRLLF